MTLLLSRRSGAWTSDELSIEFDDKKLVDDVAEKLAEHHVEAAEASIDPGTGRKLPVVQSGGKSRPRGVTRFFVYPQTITWERDSDGVSIAAGSFFDDWLENEAARGIRHFAADGQAGRIIDESLKKTLDKSVK